MVCKSVRQMELLNGLCGYVCQVMVKVKGAILRMDSGQGVSSLTWALSHYIDKPLKSVTHGQWLPSWRQSVRTC